MRILLLKTILAAIVIVSCGSNPVTVPVEVPVSIPVDKPNEIKQPEPEPVFIEVPATFDPAKVSREYRYSTKTEVQDFIDDINDIISRENFRAWRALLSQEYIEDISSADYLRYTSEQPAMKTRNIVLRTLEDYFRHVVVPSRHNLNYDSKDIDIEFISLHRVKAFTTFTNSDGEEVRLRLYDLEKINNKWTIVH